MTSGRGRLLVAIVAVIAVAAFLRLRHLGYAEYQGDEARAMLMADTLVRTRSPEILWWHKKGPGEVLVPAGVMALGLHGETAARLPFALAGLLAVLGVAWLGARLWNPWAGIIAGAIVALDGYLVAFARIVQYQSLVALASVIVVALAVEVWRRRDGPVGGPDVALALAAGVVTGLGSWAHYEMVFALVPALWLLAARAWADPGGTIRGRVLRGGALVGACLVACAVAAGLFYIPFVRHPHFAATLAYIGERRVGGGLLYNNLGDWFLRASFYNAPYWVVALAGGLLLALAARLREALADHHGTAWAAGWLGAVALAALAPRLFILAGPRGDMSWAVLVFVPAFAVLALSPRLDIAWRGMFLWFAGPFVAAGFLVTKPHTHFYTMIPGAALLLGWGAWRLVESTPSARRRLVWAGLAGFGVLAAVALLYDGVVFVRHDPEYKRVYPEARLPGVWLPYGDDPPRGGYFGFPYQAGWRQVAAWFADGTLQGDYDSNEEPLITGWYTGGAPRCATAPRYTLVAWRPQDEAELPLDQIRRDDHLWGVVTVGGQEKLWVYDREPVDGAVRRVNLEPGAVVAGAPGVTGGALKAMLADRMSATTQALEMPVPALAVPKDLGDVARLVSAEVRPTARPGGAVEVTLGWQALETTPINYSTFVHVLDAEGKTVAQSDSWPACGAAPTAGWSPGGLVFDAHAAELPKELPLGRYEVRVGMYDPATGARLATPDGAAEISLGWVEVSALARDAQA